MIKFEDKMIISIKDAFDMYLELDSLLDKKCWTANTKEDLIKKIKDDSLKRLVLGYSKKGFLVEDEESFKFKSYSYIYVDAYIGERPVHLDSSSVRKELLGKNIHQEIFECEDKWYKPLSLNKINRTEIITAIEKRHDKWYVFTSKRKLTAENLMDWTYANTDIPIASIYFTEDY